MKEQLSNEEIAKVFAMYLGCIIQHEDDQYAELIGVVNVDAHFIHEKTGSYGYKDVRFTGKLLLKSLSEISDEDTIEAFKLQYPAFVDCETIIVNEFDIIYLIPKRTLPTGKEKYYDRIMFNVFGLHFSAMQFLISKGYAVPLFFAPNHWANGKTAIELGIAIPETTSHNQQ